MKAKPIATIKQLLKEGKLTGDKLEQLRVDSRKGVQNLLRSYDRSQAKKEELKKRFKKMWHIEQTLYEAGVDLIAGTDEAGRGPLAGPVVAASVILPKSFNVIGIIDSKQLTKKEREYFFEKIQEESIAYSVFTIDNHEIDRINILEATKQCMEHSLLNLQPQPDYALIDAVRLENLSIPSKSIVKGDEKSISIAAASILAKVTRDRIMLDIARDYPDYGFDKHKGYGTKDHLEKLKKLGPTPYHRYSFTPVKNLSS